MDMEQYPRLGQLELIETKNLTSSVNSADFVNIKEGIFNCHLVTFNDMEWGTADTFYCRLSDDGGVTFESGSNYSGAQQYGSASGSYGESRRSNTDKWDRLLQNQANNAHSGYMIMYNLGDANRFSFATQHTINWSSGNVQFKYGSHVYNSARKINAFRFYTASYAFTGSISVYGMRFS